MPGYKQLLASSKPAREDVGAPSALFDHLLHLWGHGEINAAACQKLAHCAHLDGLQQDSLVKMASAGSWGQHPGNISRDLKTQISKESQQVSLPMPSAIKNCPCWNPRLSQAETADFFYFDPADAVAALYAGPKHFHKFFVTQELLAFWSGVLPHDPRLESLQREAGITRDMLHQCEVQMSTLEAAIPQVQMRSVAEELNCRISPHPLFTLPGLTHVNVCQDAMHILFCKGVLSHCMGNALKHWCWHSAAVAGGTPKAKLTTIWQSIQQLYKDHGVEQQLRILKLSMFVDTDRPHQSQPFLKTKAAECKSLVSIFPALALQFNSGSNVDSKMIEMFEAMAAFVDVMDAAGRHPTQEESSKALDCCLQFLNCYKWLQLHRVNPFMWHTVGKFHMAKHMAMFFQFGSPKYSWCFRSEDFVGRIAKISHSAAFGVAAIHLSAKITEKYRLMMFIRMWQES
eukprot:Skav219669  [mRNA]  locus=scaffold3149:14778:16496:- [translate_table: standard]